MGRVLKREQIRNCVFISILKMIVLEVLESNLAARHVDGDVDDGVDGDELPPQLESTGVNVSSCDAGGVTTPSTHLQSDLRRMVKTRRTCPR